MRTLILGGTGNISTPLTHLLVEQSSDVTVLNRGLRSTRIPSSVKTITADRKDHETFRKLILAAGHFDCVVDMIGFTPKEVALSIELFRGRIKQYIFCSTVDVYTKPAPAFPIREDSPKVPSGEFQYAFDKARCEEMLLLAHDQGDFAVTILRPAQTYSEGGSPLVHAFRGGTYHLDRIQKGKPIIVHGDGSSLWVACHAIDVARAFFNAIGNANAFGKSYNVTGEEWMTYNAYWSAVAEVMGVATPELVHIPTDLLVRTAPELASWCGYNFQYVTIFNNDAARADLGFRYTIGWKEGVRRCLDWLAANGTIEDSSAYAFYDHIVESWKKHSSQMVVELAGKYGIH